MTKIILYIRPLTSYRAVPASQPGDERHVLVTCRLQARRLSHSPLALLPSSPHCLVFGLPSFRFNCFLTQLQKPSILFKHTCPVRWTEVNGKWVPVPTLPQAHHGHINKLLHLCRPAHPPEKEELRETFQSQTLDTLMGCRKKKKKKEYTVYCKMFHCFPISVSGLEPHHRPSVGRQGDVKKKSFGPRGD